MASPPGLRWRIDRGVVEVAGEIDSTTAEAFATALAVCNQIVGGIFSVRAGHESVVLDLCADRDGAALCAWVGDLCRPPRNRPRSGDQTDRSDK